MPGSSVHPFSNHDPSLQDYHNLINELNDQVATEQPDDILQFCYDFFHTRLSEERSKTRNPDTFHGNNDQPPPR